VRLGVAIATWILLASPITETVARAEPASSGQKRPVTAWSKGVPAASQDKALKLFREGNVFLEQYRYSEAVAKYEPALAAWDHPNIRFNMAICLINMRQPLAAWDHLQRALRFGDAPLGERLYAEAKTATALLESSLAELTVRSTQPDVSVMVDGGQVLAGAGEHTMKLLPGKHQLVATRPGYVTESRALDLPAGTPVSEQVSLAPETVKVQRENYERRWRWWIPWSVAGTSVVLGLAGTALYLDARSQIQQYDDALVRLCPDGCSESQIPASLVDQRSAATTRSGIAIGMWVVAGGLAITGGVMAILNRPHKEERTVVPSLTVSRDHVGVGVSIVLD
jgi:tetratricopeptide (TPR) repeat protein